MLAFGLEPVLTDATVHSDRPTFTRAPPLSLTHTIRGVGIPIPNHEHYKVSPSGFEPPRTVTSIRPST